MEIKKEIISKIERDYFFVVGDIDIEADYFINKIEEGIKESPLNHKTNVIGGMTDWQFFMKDKKLLEILLKIVDYLEFRKITTEAYNLKDAWGVRESFGEYTKEHAHIPSFMSGSIYLNSHTQKLYFPDIDEEVEAKKGRFVLFSSFLKHYAKRITTYGSGSKYAIAFNFDHVSADFAATSLPPLIAIEK